jgi:hypothetical protein
MGIVKNIKDERTILFYLLIYIKSGWLKPKMGGVVAKLYGLSLG